MWRGLGSAVGKRHGVALAIFDLDNTLLAGDSDHLWGEFLVRQGAVDGTRYQAENTRFYEAYRSGELDIHAFLRFALAPLAAHPRRRLEQWRERFMAEDIRRLRLPAAEALLDDHRARGDTLLIITATNRFVTEPIARWLGVCHLLATDPAEADGRFTGDVEGVPCFQEGKVQRLAQWMADKDFSLEQAFFYSDSRNDLPLLELVGHPVAVDPDPVLAETAARRHWPRITLRRGPRPVPL